MAGMELGQVGAVGKEDGGLGAIDRGRGNWCESTSVELWMSTRESL